MTQTMYLLTGAAGNLGSNISRQLVNKGCSVRALVLPNDKAVRYVPTEADICFGDIMDNASLEQFFTVPENTSVIVIHCASIVTVDPSFQQKVYDINVTGTKNIIQKCLENNVEKLVYISSTGAIPEQPGHTLIKEVSAFEPQKVIGCYSQSKALASQAVLDAVKEHDLNACIICPSGICGPNDYSFGEAATVICDVVNGKMPVGIAGSFNLCDVRDLADGVIKACDRGQKGECYIFGNKPVTLKEFSQVIADVSNCKPIRFFLPIPLANAIAKLMEVRAKRTGKPTILTTFAVYNLARNNHFDSSKAQKELGYCTRPFIQTISDEVRWLQAEGKC